MAGCFLVAATIMCAATLLGCGAHDPYVGSWGTAGMITIQKSGDTYLIHDSANPFGNDYKGQVSGGKLVAKDGAATFTYTLDGKWLVRDGDTRFEKN
jgi:hypothetical protein